MDSGFLGCGGPGTGPAPVPAGPAPQHRVGAERPAPFPRCDLGARVVRDAQTLNNALGYEMNTIEFAVKDGVPYAIDFLNPAPDFERDRITPFYFDMVVQRMADLVIDRALNGTPQQTWPRWAQMTGLSNSSAV